MEDNERWQIVRGRDSSFDGAFVYAVSSTGVYCRPSCPSRRPRRENVSFFPLPETAERAGFRPCRRCRPDREDGDPRVRLVRRVCQLIDETPDSTPTLPDLAARVGLSPQHLQRTFKSVLGISPRQYADSRQLDDFKRRLGNGASISGALYGAGYSSTSRIYERAPEQLGMTPASYQKGGAGATIRYTVRPSPLGRVLVGATGQGVCAVYLGDDDDGLVSELQAEYPRALTERDEAALGRWVETILDYLCGRRRALDLPLDVVATAFQRRVWECLRSIPYGETRSYSEMARTIGAPNAARAVGRACATNPVSLVIPCHRAVRADGALGGYRWGLERKRRLLAGERERAGSSG